MIHFFYEFIQKYLWPTSVKVRRQLLRGGGQKVTGRCRAKNFWLASLATEQKSKTAPPNNKLFITNTTNCMIRNRIHAYR